MTTYTPTFSALLAAAGFGALLGLALELLR